MSFAGSPSSTTKSASIPLAMRPLWLENPKRAAGFVVREARICGKSIPARDIQVNSSEVSNFSM